MAERWLRVISVASTGHRLKGSGSSESAYGREKRQYERECGKSRSGDRPFEEVSGTSRSRSVSVEGRRPKIAESAEGGSDARNEQGHSRESNERGRQVPDEGDDTNLANRSRKISPVVWKKSKAQFGRGCWQCGGWGHFIRDSKEGQRLACQVGHIQERSLVSVRGYKYFL